MYSCTAFYPDQQKHNIYINIIYIYIVNTPTCFNASAPSSTGCNINNFVTLAKHKVKTP
jgi:hypothetical protein